MTPANKKLLVIAVAAVVGLSVLGWVGKVIVGNMVGYGMRKAIEAGTGVKVDDKSGAVTYKGADGATMQITNTNSDSGNVTFTDKDGKTTTINSQGGGDVKTLPKDFPSDFPIMGGMTVASTYSMASGGSSTYTVQWTTAASASAVNDYYVQALKDKGWTVTAQTTSDSQFYISFERGAADAQQKDGGWVTATPGDNGQTNVGVYLGINAKP